MKVSGLSWWNCTPTSGMFLSLIAWKAAEASGIKVFWEFTTSTTKSTSEVNSNVKLSAVEAPQSNGTMRFAKATYSIKQHSLNIDYQTRLLMCLLQSVAHW